FGKNEQAAHLEYIAKMEKEIKVYEDQINEARRAGLNIEGALTKEGEARLAQLREQLQLLRSQDALNRWGTQDQNDRRLQQGQRLTGPDAGKIAAALAGGSSSATSQMSEFARAFENLRAKILGAASGLDASFMKE